MSELTGHRQLTPYRGGWCCNEMYPEVLNEDLRRKAGNLVGRLGSEDYRGFFEVDVLVDTDTDEVYLGELNPRISGASSITNVTAGAYADIPLVAFHLLEFFEVAFELDVDEINARWCELAAVDQWSQMVSKETSPLTRYGGSTPASRWPVLRRKLRPSPRLPLWRSE
jgi:biotin carboxylase